MKTLVALFLAMFCGHASASKGMLAEVGSLRALPANILVVTMLGLAFPCKEDETPPASAPAPQRQAKPGLSA